MRPALLHRRAPNSPPHRSSRNPSPNRRPKRRSIRLRTTGRRGGVPSHRHRRRDTVVSCRPAAGFAIRQSPAAHRRAPTRPLQYRSPHHQRRRPPSSARCHRHRREPDGTHCRRPRQHDRLRDRRPCHRGCRRHCRRGTSCAAKAPPTEAPARPHCCGRRQRSRNRPRRPRLRLLPSSSRSPEKSTCHRSPASASHRS